MKKHIYINILQCLLVTILSHHLINKPSIHILSMQGLEKIQGCHCPGPLQDAWKRAPAILPASLRSVPMSGATPLQTVEIHLQRGDSMGIDPKKGMGIDKLDDNGW